MEAVCAHCATPLPSYEEVLLSEDPETVRIWAALTLRLTFVGDVFCGGGQPALGAAELNRLRAPCPRCRSEQAWKPLFT